MRLLVWVIALALPALAYGFAEVPPGDMTCFEVTGDDGDPYTDDTPYPNARFLYLRCRFPPHISKFVRSDADNAQYAVIMVPRYPTGKLKLRVRFDGYSARPTVCAQWPDTDNGSIIMRHCPDHYPDVALYGGGTGTWGGPINGENAIGWRVAAVMKYVNDHYGSLVDWGNTTLGGCSYGGSTSMLQSMLIPDPWTKALITNVSACVPPTLMVEQSAPAGQYWRQPSIQQAWGGFDYRLADIREQATGRMYYRVNGSPLDTAVGFDLRFFPWIGDDKRVPVFGTWHNCGHNPTCAGINLSFFWEYTDTGMEHRLDQPQVAFLHSSANWTTGDVGHWNLGLAWWNAGMVNTPTKTLIPLRYVPWTNIGGGVPDQPGIATFDVTIRATKMPLKVGDKILWAFGFLGGMATVTVANELTITGLSLPASTNYTGLELTK